MHAIKSLKENESKTPGLKQRNFWKQCLLCPLHSIWSFPNSLYRHSMSLIRGYKCSFCFGSLKHFPYCNYNNIPKKHMLTYCSKLKAFQKLDGNFRINSHFFLLPLPTPLHHPFPLTKPSQILLGL